jgi:hypothetical protein
MCFRDHSGRGFFEEGDDLLSLDGREARQELVDGLAAGEVVDERLYRHAESMSLSVEIGWRSA